MKDTGNTEWMQKQKQEYMEHLEELDSSRQYEQEQEYMEHLEEKHSGDNDYKK